MKIYLLSIVLVILSIGLFSFIEERKIPNCYISFSNAASLTMQPADRLPETVEKFRKLPTIYGNIKISRIDGYRVLYQNEKKAPFVNLKVELSKEESYAFDTTGLLRNIRWMRSTSNGLTSKD